ncbi:MAG: AbrB/MazE/SpoVT family DNA-binding domain-containing protein [Bryobacteraceae bacterium]|jgi:AbrB family looped-hinge helix DNA binding protein
MKPKPTTMKTARLLSKGRLTLPKAIRDAHHWDAGTEFAVEDTPGGIVLRPVSLFPPSRLEDVVGCLHYTGRPKTLKQMERAISKGVAERHARGRY